MQLRVIRVFPCFIYKILLTLFIITSSLTFTNSLSTAIIGGSPANPGEFPWMVSVMLRHLNGTLEHLCGGTLIDMNFVITASHCVMLYQPSDLMIKAGANRLAEVEQTQQVRQVDEVKWHQQFSFSPVRHDIARLRVSVAFMNTTYVTYAVFPPANHLATGLCSVAGFGPTTIGDANYIPNRLNKAFLPIVPKNECYDIYKEEYDNTTQICAGFEQGGVDACVGDTGGALICSDLGQRYFAGIVSWGYLCAMPRRPGVYTEISKYIQWIIS